MPSKKITAMPNLAGGQVSTDLATLVDLSVAVASQNTKSTLDDLFSIITKNITDQALRWGGVATASAPAVSAANAGAIYFNSDSDIFLASQNGAAYIPLIAQPGTPLHSVQFNSP